MDIEVPVEFELSGWTLFFALLKRRPSHEPDLVRLRADCVARARSRLDLDSLAVDPTVAGLRKLFRASGCDPTRYRPSSEALLRRVLKGDDLPAIHPLVDLNNCLSLEMAVPCCVMMEEKVGQPYTLRAGRPGESYESLKGPFNLEGKPLLVDAHGPCDAPITGSRRVMIDESTQSAWLVAYLPSVVVEPESVHARLAELLAVAPVAELLGSCYRPTETEETHQQQDGKCNEEEHSEQNRCQNQPHDEE